MAAGTPGSTGQSQLYLDDFSPGQIYPGQSRKLGQGEFQAFAAITGDAHPIHYDPEYAAKTRFGKCVAHGLLVTSVGALGATPVSDRLREAMVALLEQDAKFLRPVLVEDQVRTEFEVESVQKKPASSTGVVRFVIRVYGANGDLAMQGHHSYLIKRKEQSTGDKSV